MRNLSESNFPAFDAAARALRLRGWEVISPADLDREQGIQGTEDPSILHTQKMRRAYMYRDCTAIIGTPPDFNDGCHAIFALPGAGGKGRGSTVEIALMEYFQGRIFTRLEDVPDLLDRGPDAFGGSDF
jgi:hypothetical protein